MSLERTLTAKQYITLHAHWARLALDEVKREAMDNHPLDHTLPQLRQDIERVFGNLRRRIFELAVILGDADLQFELPKTFAEDLAPLEAYAAELISTRAKQEREAVERYIEPFLHNQPMV